MTDEPLLPPCHPTIEQVGKYLQVPPEVLAGAEPAHRLADLHAAMLEAALAHEPARVSALLSQGAARLGDERLYATFMGMVGPVVRRIEQLWKSDTVPFATVLGAYWAIQSATRRVRAGGHGAASGRPGRIHVATLEGAEHTFGAVAVARLLTDAGWDVTLNISGVARYTFAELETQPHDVVAISVGNDIELEQVNRFVTEARRASASRGICAIAGGNVFASHAEGFGFLDVDLVARRADDALDFLMRRLSQPSVRERVE